MFNKLAGKLCIVFCLVFIIEALLPSKVVSYEIDNMSRRNYLSADFLVFLKGRAGKCNINQASYDLLKPGEQVTVYSSRIVKLCVGIDRGGVAIYRKTYWRPIMLIASLISIVISIKLMKQEA